MNLNQRLLATLTTSIERSHELPPNGGHTDGLEAAEGRRAETRCREVPPKCCCPGALAVEPVQHRAVCFEQPRALASAAFGLWRRLPPQRRGRAPQLTRVLANV